MSDIESVIESKTYFTDSFVADIIKKAYDNDDCTDLDIITNEKYIKRMSLSSVLLKNIYTNQALI